MGVFMKLGIFRKELSSSVEHCGNVTQWAKDKNGSGLLVIKYNKSSGNVYYKQCSNNFIKRMMEIFYFFIPGNTTDLRGIAYVVRNNLIPRMERNNKQEDAAVIIEHLNTKIDHYNNRKIHKLFNMHIDPIKTLHPSLKL
jgi:hypothetical protein